MPRYPVFFLIVMSMTLFPLSDAAAEIETALVRTLPTEAPPLDIAVTANGKYSFILTEGGRIIVMPNDGGPSDTIQVPATVVGIAVSPDGKALFLQDRQNKTVQVMSISFIVDIFGIFLEHLLE